MDGVRQPAGRACIVRHSYYPSELNVKREAEALRDEGFDVTVICLRGQGEPPQESVDGVTVHRLPVRHRRGHIGRYLVEYNAFFALASVKLLRLHLAARFRVIQVNTMPDYLVFVTAIPRLMGARVVLHMHEPVPELFGTLFAGWYKRPLLWAIRGAERWALRFADRALTVTDEMRDNFSRRGADMHKFRVILNVPDDQVFRLGAYEEIRRRAVERKRSEAADGTLRILTHGAIEERYGPDLVVRALAQLRAEFPGLRFRLLGAGDYAGEVLRLASDLGVEERVDYLGFVPFDEMIVEILLADVAVVPVRKNPYSVLVHTNKMYEYIALHRPVVASRLDSVAASFPDDTLLYFTPDDEGDLARQLRHALTHRDEMQARAAAAYALYRGHAWTEERETYLGVCRGCWGSPSARRPLSSALSSKPVAASQMPAGSQPAPLPRASAATARRLSMSSHKVSTRHPRTFQQC
ncbi:MAG: glycosyltransferase [Dehalococcoidia bacterium]|nr:glycosyltransferase [Dehalococcoidia bacterium]